LVNGSATVAGTAPLPILNVIPTGGDYEEGTVYQIMQTVGGTISNGTSFQIQNPLSGHQFSLTQDPTDHFLYLTLLNSVPIVLPTAGLTGNRLVIANYLNSLRNVPAFEPIFDELALHFDFENIQTTEAYEQTLDLICPARNAFSTFASQMAAFAFSEAVDLRMANQRFLRKAEKDGRIKNASERLALLAFHRDVSQGDDFPVLGGSPMQPEVAAEKRSCAQQSVWAAPFGIFAHEKAQDQTPAFNLNTGGVLLGFDALDCERVLVGWALGYAYLHLDEERNFGKAWLNDYTVSLYSSFSLADFYLNLTLWGGYHTTHNRRNVFFQGFDKAARSKTDGWQAIPHLEMGYDFFFGWIGVEPYASFDWAVNFEKGFTEKGAEPLNMTQKAHTSSLLRSEAGLACYQTRKFSNGGVFIAKEYLSYVNQTPCGGNGHVSAAIVGAPGGTFTVVTLTETQNLASPGFELLYRSREAAFASLAYEGQFGTQYWSNTIVLKAGKEF
jgi:uncharacterized protein with beta-barrel porin domain